MWLTLLSGMIGSTTVLGLYEQNMAQFDLTIDCTSGPPTSDYVGHFYSDGMAEMDAIDTISPSFNMTEVSAFSHITLRYRYEGYKILGKFYNIDSGKKYIVCAEIHSLETGGGDTFVGAWVQFGKDFSPKDGKQRYEFVPECVMERGRANYQGPYTLNVKTSGKFQITCTYRAITLGHPVACYSGLATCQDITACLTKLNDFTLSAMSLPSKSTTFPYYELDFHGTYSIIGMGIWTDTYDGSNGAGSFDGAMYKNSLAGGGDVVIVEGFAGMNCSAGSLCPQGSFSLRTWELGIVGDETIVRTATVPKLSETHKWSCSSNGSSEYHFDVEGCTPSTPPWDVHWLGLWSQYSNFLEEKSNSQCWPVNPQTPFNNLMMIPHGYDTQIFATVSYNYIGFPYIEFTVYGPGCGNGPCNGPGMLLGCERAVNHHATKKPWVDVGVGIEEKSFWISDKMGYLGAQPYDGLKSVKSIISKWVANMTVAQSPITFTQYFHTHSRSLAALDFKSGTYPNPTETDVVFEGLSADYVDNPLHSLFRSRELSPAKISSTLRDEPYTIVCYLTVGPDCVLSLKPACAVWTTYSDLNEAIPVEVKFAADVFIKMGGLDKIVGFAKHRAQVQLFYPNSTLVGPPVDVTGLMVPFQGDDTPNPNPTSIDPSDDVCSCRTKFTVFWTFLTIAAPLFTSAFLQMYHMADDRIHEIVYTESVYLVVIWIVLVATNPIIVSCFLDVLFLLGVFAQWCLCGWWQCLRGSSGTPLLPVTPQQQYGATNAAGHMVLTIAEECANSATWVQALKQNGNGDASPGKVMCNPGFYDGYCADTFQPGISELNCDNNVNVYFRPMIGLERSIEEIILEGKAENVSLYGFGTVNNDDDNSTLVGLVCTLPVVLTFTSIKINGNCELSVNGLESTAGTEYTLLSPGITSVTFPYRPTK